MKTGYIHCGDCLEFMRTLPDDSIHAIVTDPPYGLSFMGKAWDYDVPKVDIWRECLRVLKPGGHLLAFAGTRTQHRMAVNIEDAGFEIRDMIAWVYGSGFPKSLDVSKAIDKEAGAEREVIGKGESGANSIMGGLSGNIGERGHDITAPATDAARQWQGWGTALKPSLEPITVARKPFPCTVAQNVQQHGTGALNIDGTRLYRDPDDTSGWSQSPGKASGFSPGDLSGMDYSKPREQRDDNPAGRWPANFIHDGSDEVLALMPEEGGSSAARYFYVAKASAAERNAGCGGLAGARGVGNYMADAEWIRDARHPDGGYKPAPHSMQSNHHPTVKPVDLMRYLIRLVTPPGGIVFDPFIGSGTTAVAAIREGVQWIGCEIDSDYVTIAKRRTAQRGLFSVDGDNVEDVE